MVGRKMVHTYTHTGWKEGCDNRTQGRPGLRILLRRGKTHWITPRGQRFSLLDGFGVGTWPMYSIDLGLVESLDQPVRR